MKTIAFIIPYFGQFPNYFDLWLKSAEKNPTIDFYIITDNPKKCISKNIRFILCSFEDIQNKIFSLFGKNAVINAPYKLCDYRPMYFDIFKDILKNYDFWGYCDIDLILGDIRLFLNDKILESYDKIYERGHMTLFKNCNLTNYLYKNTQHNAHSVFNYKEVMRSNNAFHFDEGCGISVIAQKEGLKIYKEIDFADLRVESIRFRLAQSIEYCDNEQIYEWIDGHLYGLIKADNKVIKKEIIYVHLQKRNMKNELSKFINHFLIVPNNFIKATGNVSGELIHNYSSKDKFHLKKLQVKIKEITDRMSITHLKVVIRNLRYR